MRTAKRLAHFCCQGEGTHHHPATPVHRLSFVLSKLNPRREKHNRMLQMWHSIANTQNKPSEMHHWVRITASSGRKKFKAGNFSVSSPPLHSPFFPILFWTEIHPGNLDKTSCHTAGWQLKVYLKHTPIPHVKQKNGTNHHFHVFVLWNPQFLQSILKGWVDPQNISDLKNSTQLPLSALLDLKQSAHYAWEAWGTSLKPGRGKFLQCFRKKCLSHCSTASVRCCVKSMNKPHKNALWWWLSLLGGL